MPDFKLLAGGILFSVFFMALFVGGLTALILFGAKVQAEQSARPTPVVNGWHRIPGPHGVYARQAGGGWLVSNGYRGGICYVPSSANWNGK